MARCRVSEARRAHTTRCVNFSRPVGLRRKHRLRRARWRPYRSRVDFSDSTFAALNLREEPLHWGPMLVLALVLTLAAASAGILAGGLLA